MTTNAPAGWYTDPHHGAQLRYWDGLQWTGHVAPGGPPPAPVNVAPGHAGGAPASNQGRPRKKLGAGAIVAIVLGGLVVLTIAVGLIAAVAIPVFLNQQKQATEAAARADAHTLGVEIASFSVEAGTHPDVISDGTYYLLSSPGHDTVRVAMSEGVEFGEYVSDGYDYCVGTVVRHSDESAAHFSYTSDVGLKDVPCAGP